jgi:hypothetical protein
LTALAEDIVSPNTEIPAVNVGFSAAVNVFKNSAVSASVGADPPTHEAPALKFVEPWIHPIAAPIPMEGNAPIKTAISTETNRMNDGADRLAS